MASAIITSGIHSLFKDTVKPSFGALSFVKRGHYIRI